MPKEILEAQRAKILWCVHVLGPDELHAMPNYEVAEQHAAKLIEAIYNERTAALDVLCLPIVAPWPHSAKTHAKALESYDPLSSEPQAISTKEGK